MKWDDLGHEPMWRDIIAHKDQLNFIRAEAKFCNDVDHFNSFTAYKTNANRELALQRRRIFLQDVIRSKRFALKLNYNNKNRVCL